MVRATGTANAASEAHRLKVIYPWVTSRRLHLIILPTEQCNFRCTYCYEDFSIGRMQPPIVTGIKRLLDARSAGLESLAISWFGGEPLVAKSIVLDISRHACELARAHSKIHLQIGITTNGFLLDDRTAHELSGAGVTRYQITLDGPRECHDRTRRHIAVGGSFDRIWENLLRMRTSALDFEVTIRVNVSPDNLGGMDAFIERIRQEFLADRRFTVFFKEVGKWGGPNDDHLRTFTHAEGETIITELLRKAHAGFDRHRSPTDQDAELNPCYAARANSLVIRADGRIGKCTVALRDPRNNVGLLRSDGTVAINHARLAPWLRGIDTLDPDALGCPLEALPEERGTPATIPLVPAALGTP